MKFASRLVSVAGVTALSALALAGCGNDEPEASVAPASWLIAVSGEATVEDVAGDRYLLLEQPTDALMFSDRPGRVRVDVGPEAVVGLWVPLGFSADAPNAAVSVDSAVPVFTTIQDPAWTESGSIRWRIVGGDIPPDGPAAIMIDNGVVNSQVIDSVTQTNTKVLGTAPAEGMAGLYTGMAQSVASASASASAAESAQKMQVVADQITGVATRIIDTGQGQGVPGATTPTAD